MDIERRKDLILELIRLGMDYDHAKFVAECSDEELDILAKDEAFKHKCQVALYIEERDLLTKLNDVITINVAEGKSSALFRKLGFLCPEKYAPGVTVQMKTPPSSPVFKPMKASEAAAIDRFASSTRLGGADEDP